MYLQYSSNGDMHAAMKPSICSFYFHCQRKRKFVSKLHFKNHILIVHFSKCTWKWWKYRAGQFYYNLKKNMSLLIMSCRICLLLWALSRPSKYFDRAASGSYMSEMLHQSSILCKQRTILLHIHTYIHTMVTLWSIINSFILTQSSWQWSLDSLYANEYDWWW